MILKDLQNNCLPTQSSQPQRRGEGQNPPLALRQLQSASGARGAGRKPRGARALPALSQDLTQQLLLLVALALLSVLGYFFVTRFIATSVIVQGRSMAPTLQDGERLILYRWSYLCHPPKRGDVVVVKDPGHTDYAVKRVIATPCDWVYFRRGAVLVNGKYLVEPYLAANTQTFLPDSYEKLLLMGKDRYFLLGDNRAASEDSRYYGAVHRSQIISSISR